MQVTGSDFPDARTIERAGLVVRVRFWSPMGAEQPTSERQNSE